VLASLAIFWLREREPAGDNEGLKPTAARGGETGLHDLIVPPASSSSSTAKGTEGEPNHATGAGPPPERLSSAAVPPPKASARRQTSASSRRLRLLVPAYIYPGGDGRQEWARLLLAAAKVDIVAIVNADTGPGKERIPDYSALITEASSRRVAVVGYVSTDYARRPVTDVRTDIDRWTTYYPEIAGFFLDQQPSEGQYASYYAELREYARRKLPQALVINNPGVPCDESYLAESVSAVTCVFANFEGFDQFELPERLRNYEPPRFAALPYNIPTADRMRAVVKDAIVKRIGYLYVTDAKPPNQWNKLPSYWEAEVDEVARNQ
jgi:hypothetical protein